MLPTELPVGPLSEVTRLFGSDFAARVDAVAPGEWAGPLESSYGLHLVFVSEREDAWRPTLAAVRPLVEREFLAERRKTELQALYDRLLQKYTVSIDLPKEAEGKAAGSQSGGGR
jgi:parvulin-like peptidyl-prolyl isomerase